MKSIIYFKIEMVKQRNRIMIIWGSESNGNTRAQLKISESAPLDFSKHNLWMIGHCWEVTTTLDSLLGQYLVSKFRRNDSYSWHQVNYNASAILSGMGQTNQTRCLDAFDTTSIRLRMYFSTEWICNCYSIFNSMHWSNDTMTDEKGAKSLTSLK